jgi:hypothetical protein
MSKLIIVTAILAVLACDENTIPMPGGPCEYVNIPGVVVITSIEQADTTGNNCRDSVEILFNFVPDDSTAPERYRFPNFPDTNQSIADVIGANPPAGWAAVHGISVGNEYRCLRQEITKGTCAPYGFDITEIDFSDWRDYCD